MISFNELGQLGRLGNQLFQIAATITLAMKHNDRYIFPPWPYENAFNLRGCFSARVINHDTHREPNFTYSQIPYRQNLNLSGYFQSEKYFIDCKSAVLGLLTPNIQSSEKLGYTSIHVRRGDYLYLKREYTQLDMNYYMRAMKMTNTPKYMVFSDDINWCKTNFIGPQFEFSEGKSPVEDLALMFSCEHNIIANSSFSWWGAYLNKNPSKMVVAPSKWFGPALTHNTKDLLPTNWIKL